ncbi:MOSC domain-containing protein [Mangrovibacterium marinum]|uniref:Molybdenum cofactor synthesis domain-containing protein n=1 Tax=Mangrovibacterium marinum TaxID=1639118 RepID=A0A2T5C4Z6_9BACT|nr:MOSC domain-containing protein [Mangrovibacterium marinum]PTN09935.1 molybdenum cofactor synthesis domain-containing protein [Mangrovibacterium marinum]
MTTNITILSVNRSEKKGTIKKPVPQIQLSGIGVVGDAHSGNWHRQVSLLAKESIDKFAAEAGRQIAFGEFAENITTEGLLLHTTKPLDRFVGENIELEVTQIGKKCHGDNCSIFREVGNCVMPKEGIFARVIRHGQLQAGEQLTYQPRFIRVKIITLSDRASRGEYPDKSGPQIRNLSQKQFESINRKFLFDQSLIPDQADLLKAEIEVAVNNKFDVIFTTGGTGIGPRDITPDTVQPMLNREIPGIMELIRVKYGMQKPAALLSRGIAGVIDQTLIYTMPGSVKAVTEYCNEILPTIEHALYMLHGIDSH